MGAALVGCSAGSLTVETTGASSGQRAPSRAGRAAQRRRQAHASLVAAVGAGSLGLVVEPEAGDTPFVSMIDTARASVQMTMYELTDARVERALVADAHRGVNVRVLLGGGYYGSGSEINAPAYDDLHNHGVGVRWAPTYLALTHQKTLTIDGRASAIMTLNLTSTADTRDFAVLDTQAADVHAIQATFDADFAHRRQTPSPGTGDLLWSPGAATGVLALINGAQSSIELENEEMAYAPATAALCSAARRLSVRIVMTDSSDPRPALARLAGCGAHVHVLHGQRPLYIHAKLLLVDGRVALVGSQNLSTTSLLYNRELGIRIRSPAMLRSLARTFAGDYAAAQASAG
jgi:cardiolipin synthase A/B